VAQAQKFKTADGYVRVSRRAGREGESFISPEVQRKKIQGWADLQGVEIVHWWEELDQSGKKLDRPMFQQALARCEAGETGGIVVARLDRFARSAVDALDSIRRLTDAGARVVSVDDSLDSSQASGKLVTTILVALAEMELDRITESWETANREAVARGVHVSGRTPTGYARDESNRLKRAEPAASAVAEAFRRRALGASYTDLAAFLEQEGVGPPTGNPHWSSQGVRGLLRNRVYLGEARGGRSVNSAAHEPLVTQAEFDAAQAGETLLPTRDGSLSAQALLTGILRCAGCGHTLKISGSTDKKTGIRTPNYYCRKRYASGHCPDPASARAATIDPYVETRVLAALSAEGGFLAEARAADEHLEKLQRELEQAEHELQLFVSDPRLMTILGSDTFVEGVEARQREVDEVRAQLSRLRAQAVLVDDLTNGDLLATWPELAVPDKRRLLHSLLEVVRLRPARRRGRSAPPIGERTEIILRGGVALT
jgi:site-specific DNA recombinase